MTHPPEKTPETSVDTLGVTGPADDATPKLPVFGYGSYREALRIGEILRKETVGGIMLVIAAAIAIVWANSPWAESYFSLRDIRVGYAPWHLELSLGAWAADGLLGIFFFLVGLELKREIVAGDLRDPKRAMVPVIAAVGGVVVPALIFVAVNASRPENLGGWAIPTATDIAFAVAVLAIVGSHLPSALRIFLLTLAVVDDLLAITIIAVIYTDNLNVTPLLWAVVPIGVYAFLARRYRRFFGLQPLGAWLILLPIGFVAWALFHASGVHATIAGVLLGFAVPVIRSQTRNGEANGPRLAEEFEHRFRPLSAGFAVPVFAFFSAGVAIGGVDGLTSSLRDPLTLGIALGLVVGKPIGIMGSTWLLTKLAPVELDRALRWIDMLGMALLAGIGFTVSLLIADLGFTVGGTANDHAKVGILGASVIAALLASLILVVRDRRYRVLVAEEARDDNYDGIPDVYQQRADQLN